MSQRPLRVCTDCPALVGPGESKCGEHRKPRAGYIRPARHAFYGTAAWKRFRREALDILGRRCVECGSTDRIELDHIKSVEDRPDLALEITNVRPLCKRDHSSKTMRDTRRRRR